MVKIDVTEEDIATGRKGSCSHCPIALAIRRQIDPLCWVKVVPDGISIRHVVKFRTVHFSNSDTREQFIDRFDNDEPVEPFSFELDIPDIFLKEQYRARQD